MLSIDNMAKRTFDAEMFNSSQVGANSGFMERKKDTVIRNHHHHNYRCCHHHHHRLCHPHHPHDKDRDYNVKWGEVGIKRGDKNLNSGNCLG